MKAPASAKQVAALLQSHGGPCPAATQCSAPLYPGPEEGSAGEGNYTLLARLQSKPGTLLREAEFGAEIINIDSPFGLYLLFALGGKIVSFLLHTLTKDLSTEPSEII